MNTRQMIVSAALALALSPAAFAATASPDRCSALESQFDKAVVTSHVAKIGDARSLRTEGARLCSQGKSVEGVKKLEEAVKILGETPARN